MSTGGRRNTESQSIYTRQASILRRNLADWDAILRNPRGEDWPRMLGRLNAALNQSSNMDKCIEDVMEHFVYQPKQSTANAQDVPFFLSTRLETSTVDDVIKEDDVSEIDNAVERVTIKTVCVKLTNILTKKYLSFLCHICCWSVDKIHILTFQQHLRSLKSISFFLRNM